MTLFLSIDSHTELKAVLKAGFLLDGGFLVSHTNREMFHCRGRP